MLADTIVARALSCADLCYGDPNKRKDYKNAILPTDKEPQRDGMARTMDSCLLFVRGMLAMDEVDGTMVYGGVPLDVVRAPYAKHITKIETILYALAKDRGLLRDWRDQEALQGLLKPGALLIHGSGGSLPPVGPERQTHIHLWGGVAHGFLVTEVHSGTSIQVTSMDGGQMDSLNVDPKTGLPFRTKIAERTRELHVKNGSLWLGSRRLNWGMDLGELPVHA